MAELFQSAVYLGVSLVAVCLLAAPLAVMAAVCLLYFLWDFLRSLGRGRLL